MSVSIYLTRKSFKEDSSTLTVIKWNKYMCPTVNLCRSKPTFWILAHSGVWLLCSHSWHINIEELWRCEAEISVYNLLPGPSVQASLLLQRHCAAAEHLGQPRLQHRGRSGGGQLQSILFYPLHRRGDAGLQRWQDKVLSLSWKKQKPSSKRGKKVLMMGRNYLCFTRYHFY